MRLKKRYATWRLRRALEKLYTATNSACNSLNELSVVLNNNKEDTEIEIKKPK